ncbi:mitochondrial translocator assembly and maintenance protein 41 [Geosmithia morbida]|uniref:Phosphatidate cytidylyltransferase, mitochondrial n=1 Tax=Geosmithia morbida TaxID=1094350 RepID=A0A9P5D630_9HYPO|nr:mitochondrial translocator assembly and maintenance protein 41 [Geosmithia morbida]KAF4123079.1 mitochondrial translocator assembly and maintenance protein 41 [Geosmithia morbida]
MVDDLHRSQTKRESASGRFNLYGDDWEDSADFTIKSFDDLPHRLFGSNQHMIINYELKEAMRLILRQFNAPIVYGFAYGSGVFPQEESGRSISEADFRAVHPKPPEALVKSQKGSPKMIDFIFGVSHTQHWHSINMKQHRNHYSGVASLGSGLVSRVQDWGAGVYFHPYVEVNGILIKYGVTSIDNLVNDLTTWDSLYLAGRLQKPVKILRDHPRVRLANQHNLIAAVRTALLLLPPDFTESQLYNAISGISYLGDPRMALPTENRSKVSNIVDNNMVHFRRLYAPLIKTLPNVSFVDQCRLDDEEWVLNPHADLRLQQDMDPVKRGNMVRRLPGKFRSRLYFQYQKKFALPREEYASMIRASSGDDSETKRLGGEFERRIAADDPAQLTATVRGVIKQTVNWPSTIQTLKGPLMSGYSRTVRYVAEKVGKWRKGRADEKKAAAKTAAKVVPTPAPTSSAASDKSSDASAEHVTPAKIKDTPPIDTPPREKSD